MQTSVNSPLYKLYSPDFEDVDRFHEKFNLPRGGTPHIMAPDVAAFRIGFLREELKEYMTAWRENNLVEAADALLDLVYVTFGTALFMNAGSGALVDRPWHCFEGVNTTVRFGLAPPHLLLSDWFLKYTGILLHHIDLVEYHHNNGDVQKTLEALNEVAAAAYTKASIMKVPWQACWAHVQTANMAKVRAKPDGSDSKRNSSWDVVKPSGWMAPDLFIANELEARGARLQQEVIEAAKNKSKPR